MANPEGVAPWFKSAMARAAKKATEEDEKTNNLSVERNKRTKWRAEVDQNDMEDLTNVTAISTSQPPDDYPSSDASSSSEFPDDVKMSTEATRNTGPEALRDENGLLVLWPIRMIGVVDPNDQSVKNTYDPTSHHDWPRCALFFNIFANRGLSETIQAYSYAMTDVEECTKAINAEIDAALQSPTDELRESLLVQRGVRDDQQCTQPPGFRGLGLVFPLEIDDFMNDAATEQARESHKTEIWQSVADIYAHRMRGTTEVPNDGYQGENMAVEEEECEQSCGGAALAEVESGNGSAGQRKE
ncbi:hypothetical protein BCR34DRAFT_605852 [Clohesyomyces aquaticus]|uniref:Uncharacterized protein n=1 Tax=Clohesyomyces aquaticus TaxID=1231657 RepID=A0A1Y1YUK3_9PLEO|nr:hypothetical protein BCR34DRAFT_605852 [Clohesyomyces aquaticus]